MSYKVFCQKYGKNNELSSINIKRLCDAIQNLLKKKDHPSVNEIKIQVSSILPGPATKIFANDLFDLLNNDGYSDNDYDYYEYDSKSEKSGKNQKKEEKSKQKDKKKPKRDYDDDYDYDEYYYSYYESDDFYSYSDFSEKDQKGYFNSKNPRDKKGSDKISSNNRTSEYQPKKGPLQHRVYEKNTKSDNKEFDKETTQNEKDKPLKSNVKEKVRQRYIIYVAGLSANVNTVSKLYHQFHSFGRILGIQVNRLELYALIEFNDLKSAYTAVNSKKPIFGNKLIKLGFASNVDSEMIEMFRKKEEEIEKQSKEMKSDLIFIDEDKQSDISYDQSDDESYDMPDV